MWLGTGNVRNAAKTTHTGLESNCVLSLGTWNVRSMVDAESPIEVASRRREREEDR